MGKVTQEQEQELEALQVAVQEARAAMQSNRTPETMEAYRVAWNAHAEAVVAVHGLPTPKGRGSRAGRRQAAERRAMHGRGRR